MFPELYTGHSHNPGNKSSTREPLRLAQGSAGWTEQEQPEHVPGFCPAGFWVPSSSLHDLFGKFSPLLDHAGLKEVSFFVMFKYNFFVFHLLVLEGLLYKRCFKPLIMLAAAGRAFPAGQGGHPAPLLSPLGLIWSPVPSSGLPRTRAHGGRSWRGSREG